MKFLVIRKPRVSGAMAPTSKLMREHKELLLKGVKEGRLDCIYAIPGGGGTVGIANADSVEQLQEAIANGPLFLFSEYEIRPLTDFGKYMDSVAAAFEKQGR
jgi:muconolactone delta-isomerase